MTLRIDGDIPGTVEFNSNDLQRVRVNGTTVWEKEEPSDYIEIVIDTAGNYTICNRWGGNILVASPDDLPTDVAPGMTVTLYGLKQNDTIKVSEASNGAFRSFGEENDSYPFISGQKCHISKMPPMNRFTVTDAGTVAGDRFFAYFNAGGCITRFPDGAFDTSAIASYGADAFLYFNNDGLLESLPAGSFNTDRLILIPAYFAHGFNYGGSHLLYLPAGAFNTAQASPSGSGQFDFFNFDGGLHKSLTNFNPNMVALRDTTVSYSGLQDEAIAIGAPYHFETR